MILSIILLIIIFLLICFFIIKNTNLYKFNNNKEHNINDNNFSKKNNKNEKFIDISIDTDTGLVEEEILEEDIDKDLIDKKFTWDDENECYIINFGIIWDSININEIDFILGCQLYRIENGVIVKYGYVENERSNIINGEELFFQIPLKYNNTESKYLFDIANNYKVFIYLKDIGGIDVIVPNITIEEQEIINDNNNSISNNITEVYSYKILENIAITEDIFNARPIISVNAENNFVGNNEIEIKNKTFYNYCPVGYKLKKLSVNSNTNNQINGLKAHCRNEDFKYIFLPLGKQDNIKSTIDINDKLNVGVRYSLTNTEIIDKDQEGKLPNELLINKNPLQDNFVHSFDSNTPLEFPENIPEAGTYRDNYLVNKNYNLFCEGEENYIKGFEASYYNDKIANFKLKCHNEKKKEIQITQSQIKKYSNILQPKNKTFLIKINNIYIGIDRIVKNNKKEYKIIGYQGENIPEEIIDNYKFRIIYKYNTDNTYLIRSVNLFSLYRESVFLNINLNTFNQEINGSLNAINTKNTSLSNNFIFIPTKDNIEDLIPLKYYITTRLFPKDKNYCNVQISSKTLIEEPNTTTPNTTIPNIITYEHKYQLVKDNINIVLKCNQNKYNIVELEYTSDIPLAEIKDEEKLEKLTYDAQMLLKTKKQPFPPLQKYYDSQIQQDKNLINIDNRLTNFYQ